MKVSAFSKLGSCHMVLSNQTEWFETAGRCSASFTRLGAGTIDMNVPSLNTIPNISAFCGTSEHDAFVSGPRIESVTLPSCLVITISDRYSAVEVKLLNSSPVRVCHTISTSGESEARYLNSKGSIT